MKVLLCPLSDPGFLCPVISVGLDLKSRGHDVLLIDDKIATPAAMASGLAYKDVSDETAGAFSARRWFRIQQEQYQKVSQAAKEHRPDAIVTSALCHCPSDSITHFDLQKNCRRRQKKMQKRPRAARSFYLSPSGAVADGGNAGTPPGREGRAVLGGVSGSGWVGWPWRCRRAGRCSLRPGARADRCAVRVCASVR